MSLDTTSGNEFGGELKVAKKYKDEPLSDCVKHALDGYFEHLNGHTVSNLYQMVLEEIERPLFESIMYHSGSNQTRAAEMLGISRSTLRKKLALYGIE